MFANITIPTKCDKNRQNFLRRVGKDGILERHVIFMKKNAKAEKLYSE